VTLSQSAAGGGCT